MASGLDLRQYQEDILARLEAVGKDSATISRSRLGVMVGGKRILISLEDVSEVIPLPEIFPAPNTQSWFLGMANIRGNLYAISDLAELMGLGAASKSQGARVLLLSDDLLMQSGILVESLVGLRNIDQFKEEKLSIADNYCFKPYEYRDEDNNVWLELDCQMLVSSKDFMQPYFV